MYLDPVLPACTCVRGHAVHMCGTNCSIPLQKMECGEGYVCPLSGIVVSGADLVAVPIFDSAGKCVNHWSGQSRVHKRPRRAPHRKRCFTAAACSRIIQDVLFGHTNSLAKDVMVTRASKRVARDVRAIKHNPTFADLRAVVSSARRCFGPRVFTSNKRDLVENIALAISKYMARHPRCMSCTLEVGVCTWLTMLSVGIVKEGTTVVPAEATVSQHIPPPSLMSLVPRVQCRAISVAIRHFKAYVFTSSGGVIQSRVFHDGRGLG